MADTKVSKKVSQDARKQGQSKNYHPLKGLGSIALYKKQDLVLSKYGLNYPGLRDFFVIYTNYLNNGNGISPYTILKLFNKSHGTVRCLYDRLAYLKSKDLVKCIDRKYYPTEQAIKDLNTLLKSA